MRSKRVDAGQRAVEVEDAAQRIRGDVDAGQGTRDDGQERGDDPHAVFIHPLAEVEAPSDIGEGTRIWRFCHVMAGARIGAGCSLGQGCFVAAGAVVGARVRIQNQVSVFAGVILEDEVFVGPSAVFTNVKRPRAARAQRDAYAQTRVCRGATIGANATILPGVVIGTYAFVGAGAVVTRDVPAFALVVGAPARGVGWVSAAGERLELDAAGRGVCPVTGETYVLHGGALVRA